MHAKGPKNRSMFCISVTWFIFNPQRRNIYLNKKAKKAYTTRLKHRRGERKNKIEKPLIWGRSPMRNDANLMLIINCPISQPHSAAPCLKPKDPIHPTLKGTLTRDILAFFIIFSIKSVFF
jgi:hypothetical protein